jgi:hypothetical protein
VRCKTCHYSLNGLAEHRCPECGREFDPNDAKSFEADDAPSIERRAITWIANAFAIAVIGFIMLVCIMFFFAALGLLPRT